mgnify:CR=1 FL=1
MRFFSRAVLVTILSTVGICLAQQQDAWVPQGVNALEAGASSRNSFSFDHSMLVLAAKLDPGDDDLKRVVAGISSLSVRTYKFQNSGYDTAVLNSVNDDYRSAGWKRVLNRHEKGGATGTTDVWVRMENNAIANVAVFVAKPNAIDFVAVAGSISPADLLHLGGHFGIPKIVGGVALPNTSPQ